MAFLVSFGAEHTVDLTLQTSHRPCLIGLIHFTSALYLLLDLLF